MIIIRTTQSLRSYLRDATEKGKTIGFVPTMGALHRGHISLIEHCNEQCDLSICSIFVNPTQFNNPDDLKKYPRTIERDIEMLELAACDILFLPDHSEIYPEGYQAPLYDLGELENLLEGEFRPGHFQGVCQVVDRLLQATQPNLLFLGQKDFQQCLVIKKLIKIKNYTTTVTICNTIREDNGLAMSSRNMRLSETDRKAATIIYQCLLQIQKNKSLGPVSKIRNEAIAMLEKAGLRTEYVEIADSSTLNPLNDWDGQVKTVALIAVYIGEIRLIDNLLL